MTMSVEVDGYIKKQSSPQSEIVQTLRDTILEAIPGIKEELKMGVPWYEGKFYIAAFQDHVNLGFSVNGLSKQEASMFIGKGKLMRHVKFYSKSDVDRVKIVKLLKLVFEKSICNK